MGRLAGVLEAVALSPAPRIDASGIGELSELLRLGRKVRGLGREEMIEFLRTVPMSVAELLDDCFETDLLKGLIASTALADLSQGPRAGGTAFALLHNLMGGAGAFGPRMVLADGPGALVDALVGQARAAGVEIRTDAPVVSILTRGDRVSGVVLASGEEVAAGEVVSSLGPKRTLLEMVDPVQLDPDFIVQVQNIRYRPTRSVVLLALGRLPELPGSGDGRALAGSFVIAPTLDYMERAYDATKYGGTSEEPWLDIRIPSLAQVGLAPGDEHVMVIQAQYTPYWLRGTSWERERERFGDRVVAIAGRHLEGLADRVRHRVVLTPPDVEARFGLDGGSSTQGEMMLDQILFMRPVPGWSRYAMPVPGLFLCGPGTHPGPGATGASGWLAAQAVLKARGAATARTR
jgi:phytoene dehydrogenase-like protein